MAYLESKRCTLYNGKRLNLLIVLINLLDFFICLEIFRTRVCLKLFQIISIIKRLLNFGSMRQEAR